MHQPPLSRLAASGHPAAAGAIAPRSAAALCRHVARCSAARGQWFGLRCFAEGVHRFVAPRFVTTVSTVALLLCAASLLT